MHLNYPAVLFVVWFVVCLTLLSQLKTFTFMFCVKCFSNCEYFMRYCE
jgi:hypothetical protein